jgi:hypothetical protein
MVVQLHQFSDGNNISNPRKIPLRHETFFLQKGEKFFKVAKLGFNSSFYTSGSQHLVVDDTQN